MDAFDIYIEYAPDKGEMTVKWLADCRATYILYAAYDNMFLYRELVNVVRTTGSGGKENVTDTANTLEQVQIEKLSNASEKGDKIFLGNFAAASLSSMYTVYNP